ncbi:hypothetical protein EDC02_4984 [Micromonospora sp. Llam0]|uniref:hypothetical protein n=1 Tax=Micromonospora sp. Llam0 TaxID=2485143 RepID=UPI000F480108|nr:hypothetical protein [Micromonospora sp. Llam0]ROO62975.1 hypothetical protein EDC02_4984 [Micromonospora sp. Llam0]
MNPQDEQHALRSAVDLVRTPYVVEVLDSLHHGRQPTPTTSALAEQEALELAIRRLAGVGVLAALAGSDTPHEPPRQETLSLTDLGRDVAAIVADLCREP